MYEIIFYEDKNGVSEVNNYIQQLGAKRHLEDYKKRSDKK